MLRRIKRILRTLVEGILGWTVFLLAVVTLPRIDPFDIFFVGVVLVVLGLLALTDHSATSYEKSAHHYFIACTLAGVAAYIVCMMLSPLIGAHSARIAGLVLYLVVLLGGLLLRRLIKLLVYFRRDDLALHVLDALVKWFPAWQGYHTYTNRGWLRVKQRDFQGAHADYTTLIHLEFARLLPDTVTVSARALPVEEMRLYGIYAKYADRPTPGTNWLRRMMGIRALIRHILKDLDGSLSDYDAALKIPVSPPEQASDAELTCRKIYILHDLRRSEEALTLSESARAQFPTSHDVLVAYAVSAYACGQTETAARLWRSFIEQDSCYEDLNCAVRRHLKGDSRPIDLIQRLIAEATGKSSPVDEEQTRGAE